MLFCTVTTDQHLILTAEMVKSMKQSHPGARILMCLLEEDDSYAASFSGLFDYIILAKNLGFPGFYRRVFKHTAHEAIGFCKPRLMRYALNAFPEENKFVYLDGDMKIFGPFDEVNTNLDQHSIVLSPHILEPGPNENSFYKLGVFNTSFFALNRSEESVRFLDWWVNRVEKACFNKPEHGFYLEQKWLDHAPVYFDIHVFRNQAYNVSKSNLYQREIGRSTSGHYTINGQPLKLFQFSSILKYGLHYAHYLNKFVPLMEQQTLAAKMVSDYIGDLMSIDKDFTKNVPWSYGYYVDASPVSENARIGFRENPHLFTDIANPFLKSNSTFIQRQK